MVSYCADDTSGLHSSRDKRGKAAGFVPEQRSSGLPRADGPKAPGRQFVHRHTPPGATCVVYIVRGEGGRGGEETRR